MNEHSHYSKLTEHSNKIKSKMKSNEIAATQESNRKVDESVELEMQVFGSATARKRNDARREKRREIQNEICMRGREKKKGEEWGSGEI